MFIFLHKFVLFFSCLTAMWVVLSSNPVYSVISLILTFVNAAILLILFKAEFLSLIFIVVYVGAIAILFLFVVMMIDIKEKKSSLGLGFLITGIILIFFTQNTSFIFDIFGSWNISLLKEPELYFNFDSNFNGFLMSEALFNIYYIPFLLSGILLLIALLGAILLTLSFNRGGLVQTSSRQLSRSDYFLSFVK